jgi:hypothetical protein
MRVVRVVHPRGTDVIHVLVHTHSGPVWPGIVTAVATGVIAIGVGLALFQLMEVKRSRRTETAARMSSRWEMPDYVEARIQIDSYADNLALREALLESIKNRTRDRHLLLRELSFFEELGAMEKMGAINLQWIEETMKDLVLARWDLWEATVVALRADSPKDQSIYGNFQLLVDKLQGKRLTRRQRLRRWLTGRLTNQRRGMQAEELHQ